MGCTLPLPSSPPPPPKKKDFWLLASGQGKACTVHCTSTLYRSDGAIARKPFGNCHRVTKQISFSPLIFVIWGVQVLYIIKIWKSPPLTAQWTHNMIIGCRKHSITFWYNNYIKLQHLIRLLTTLAPAAYNPSSSCLQP